MPTRRRWLEAVIRESRKTDLPTPWARGALRSERKSRCAARAIANL
ncbi:MAG: hypothetical protein ACC631_02270 [Halocynthiibacter sp.]